MRCFVGIRLPAETRDALASVHSAVGEADPAWRDQKWVAAENLHVTLAFLGEVAPDSIPGLTAAIGDRLSDVGPFSLRFVELRPAPNARRVSMLWAAYSDSEGAGAHLVSVIGRAAADFDIPLEPRAFKPHVTLARTRRPRKAGDAVRSSLARLSESVPGFLSVPSATLFASTLSKAGPHYEVLEEWAFQTLQT